MLQLQSKMMVRVTKRICKAISLGVFFLEAPSTMAIILSRKLSPASAVTRTTSQSERMVVPPSRRCGHPRFPDDRGRFACDGTLIHRCGAITTSPSMGI